MAPPSSLLTATPQHPMLLVCTSAAPAQRAEVDRLLENVRSLLNPTVQIMRVSDSTHPEVVRSFGITALPAFVLLQRGQELWRYSGPVDSADLFSQLGYQMQQPSLTTR
ncbi:hypothetical protein GCM10028805_16060 [Spirosoma harenae]